MSERLKVTARWSVTVRIPDGWQYVAVRIADGSYEIIPLPPGTTTR